MAHAIQDPQPLAVSISEAARMVGLSRTMFYREYIDSGRIVAIPKGRRRRLIDVAELRSAYQKYITEARGDAEQG